jgi:5-methylcytosine-specific restriction endonuclease McrA
LTSTAELDAPLLRECFASIGTTFRGEIWEDDPDVPMGKGYANDGKPFDINEALYLRPVFQAIRNPAIRKVVCKSAVQTLKTYVLERSAAYKIKHDPGDMTFYDADGDAANDHAKSRIGPMLKSVPGIALQVEAAIKHNRFDVTNTEFYLPGMTFRLWPLNESSTQRITLRYVFISDAFLSKRTGMLEQAIARTTQHPHDRKILIESQGGEEGDDMDLQFLSTNQGMLHVCCPECNGNQPFEWERLRPMDHPVESLRGKYAGMQRGNDADVLLLDGGYNSQAVLRLTHYECWHCGAKWRDDFDTRHALDESSNFVPLNPQANPENVGFSWPAWINPRLKWGNIMLEYLLAKRALKEFGSEEAIIQWYQKRAAVSWNPTLTQSKIRSFTESYDPDTAIPNEKMRIMTVDCQQDPDTKSVGHFWYVVRVVDKSGNSWQLARGHAKSWDEWIAVQKHFKVPNRNVGIDGRHWSPIIRTKAAECRTVEKSLDGSGKSVWATWKILRGDDTRGWRGADGNMQPHRQTVWQETILDKSGKRLTVTLNEYLWSNLTIGILLLNLRMGGDGRPKFVALNTDKLDAQTQAMERGDLTYENQMNAEYLGEIRKQPRFIEVKQNINHYLDCERMGVLLMTLAGLISHAEVQEDSGQEAE